MDFLKQLYGDKSLSYDELVQLINTHNGTPENKDNQIKLANLGNGGYVGKDKYAALETTHNSKLEELKQANTLIGELQKSNKGNEELQKKIQDYDTQVQALQAQVAKVQLDAAVKVALLEAKAQDVDYLTFKLNEEKTDFVLDENGKIKGLDEKIEGLKIKFPNQFETIQNKKIIENKLPNGTDDRKLEPTNLAEAIRAQYEQK